MQIFKRSTNTLAHISIVLSMVLLTLTFLGAEIWARSDYVTNLDVNISQPVAFSHKHHVKGLGLDCRFCHSSVENTAFAGIPTTAVCMNCHSQIWLKSDELKLVRDSYSQNVPIGWNKVYVLPDFVYFNHGIHIQKGVACATCHGQVEEMPMLHKAKAFYMRQCLECHRHPEKYLATDSDGATKHTFDSHLTTNCTACHR